MKVKKYITVRSAADVVITYVILIAAAFVFFFPVLWLILASFSKTGSIYDFKGFFPSEYIEKR